MELRDYSLLALAKTRLHLCSCDILKVEIRGAHFSLAIWTYQSVVL